MSIKHKLDLFDKLILPVLSYGSQVWGLMDSHLLENIHLKFCKKLLGVKKQTQNNFIYGELGRTSLKTMRAISVIKYWLKIAQSNETKYIKIVYNVMCTDIEIKPNAMSWAKSVMYLLQSLGFNEVWINQGVGDVDIFLNLVKQRLTDTFIQNWCTELRNSTRARSYVIFCNFGFQSYLSMVNIEKFRKSLSRFRTSSHRLKIETGRWHKPEAIPFNERKCITCNKLEDEFHALLECPLYNNMRKQLINKYFWKRPNMPKFIELLQSQNKNVIRRLSMFIFKMFELKTNADYA